MPDTDEEPSVEPTPEQWDRGDDYTESARELRTAKARAQAGIDLAAQHRLEEDDEQALLDEEADAAHQERVELTAKDQRTLEEKRHRDQLDAALDTSRAMELAYTDEVKRDAHRQRAANDQQRALGDRSHGRHERDDAAARPDEPGAAGRDAEGRRFENLATVEERRSVGEDQIADTYDASAREHRGEAREAQPSAAGAVRKPPEEAPEAQLPQDRLHVRGYAQVRDTKGNLVKPADPSKTPDLSFNRSRER